MKILLSAYACEPNRGSEPGVGWNWALEIAKRGHEVCVLTRSNNKDCIDAELSKNPAHGKIRFYYHDLPPSIARYKKLPGAIYLYYLLWQLLALKRAREIHAIEKFDAVHHITFAVFRQPSFLWKLKVPFIFGPLGGGEYTPQSLMDGLEPHHRLKERIRLLANSVAQLDPLLNATLKNSTLILTKTLETKQAIPERYWNKCLDRTEIGVSHQDQVRERNQGAHFLFVGRFIYWKGGQLAIKSFARVARKNPALHLTLCGKGPEKDCWLKLTRDEGIEHQVTFIDWLPQDQLKALYAKSDIFLFPSMHDSGGTVVLEAMACGLPVICLKLGGPGVLVNESCGLAVPVTDDDSLETVVEGLSAAIENISTTPDLAERLSSGASERARHLSWERVVDETYREIERII